MSRKIRKLLFTEDPYPDESFIGYIMRLTVINEIPEMRWILSLIGLGKAYDSRYRFSSDFRVDSKSLAELAGVNITKIQNLLYVHEQEQIQNITGNILVFGERVPYYFVKREKPKICPACLIERNYLRKVWEISPITGCPNHRCLLIDQCPQCSSEINWTRPAIHLCHCKFDFCHAGKIILEKDELRLTTYLYQKFALPIKGKKVSFSFPLNTLEIEDLIILLIFIAGLLSRDSKCFGSNITRYKNNAEIHRFLCDSVKVFDNWATSYHEFIRTWQKPDDGYFINGEQRFLSKIELPRKYQEYQLLYQFMHTYLEEVPHYFMFQEFENFLMSVL